MQECFPHARPVARRASNMNGYPVASQDPIFRHEYNSQVLKSFRFYSRKCLRRVPSKQRLPVICVFSTYGEYIIIVIIIIIPHIFVWGSNFVRHPPPPSSVRPPPLRRQLVSINLSLRTCLYQLVSINLPLPTCLYQLVSGRLGPR